MYVTIFYNYYKETVISKLPYVKFYRGLNDNTFIIIDHGPRKSEALQLTMDDFEPIKNGLNG